MMGLCIARYSDGARLFPMPIPILGALCLIGDGAGVVAD